MKIESIRLKNFKAFRDVHLGELPNFCVVVGANGSGKTTLFDVFAFLHDCLKGNVRQALDARGRFKEVISRDSTEDTILIELQYRMEIVGVDRLVTYSLAIGEREGVPVVKRKYSDISVDVMASRITFSISWKEPATQSRTKRISINPTKNSLANTKLSTPPTS